MSEARWGRARQGGVAEPKWRSSTKEEEPQGDPKTGAALHQPQSRWNKTKQVVRGALPCHTWKRMSRTATSMAGGHSPFPVAHSSDTYSRPKGNPKSTTAWGWRACPFRHQNAILPKASKKYLSYDMHLWAVTSWANWAGVGRSILTVGHVVGKQCGGESRTSNLHPSGFQRKGGLYRQDTGGLELRLDND